MRSTSLLTFKELERTFGKIRSLSGCFRLARHIELRDMDIERSGEKITFLTRLLEKMKELSGVDPEVLSSTHSGEYRALIRNYAVVLTARAGQRNLGGEDLAEAESDARTALRMSRAIGDEVVESLALNHLGNNLMITRRIPEAHTCFQAGVDLDRRSHSKAALTRSLYNRARAELSLGIFHRALESVNEGLTLYEGDASLPVQTHAFFLSVRQDIFESQDEPGKALVDGLRSLELFQRSDMTDRLAAAHFHLVRRYLMLDQPFDAMHHALEISSAASQTGNPVDRILAVTALSSVYIRLDDLESAERFSREGLESARSISMRPMEVLNLERLARIARRRGDQDEAESLLREALSKEDGHRNRAELHRIIASLLLEQGKLETAEHEVREGLAIIRSLRDMKADTEFLLVHAAIARQAGRLEEAIEMLTPITRKQQVRPTFRKEAHELLSGIYKERNELDKALHHFHQHHTLAVEMEGKLAEHRLIALRAHHEVESHRDDAREARELQRRVMREKEQFALQVSERQQIIEQIRQEVGNVIRNLRRNNVPEGESQLEEVLRMLNSVPDSGQQLMHHLPNLDENFFTRLQKRYPMLTNGQLRLCGLLRSGLSSSDIARHLHLSIETVTTQRKRLRKKMDLKTGENLERTLAEI